MIFIGMEADAKIHAKIFTQPASVTMFCHDLATKPFTV